MLILRAGGQQQRLQPRTDALVDAGHLIFQLEVGAVPHALHQNVGVLCPCVVRQQAAPVLHLYVGEVRHAAADQLQPPLRREHGQLLLAVDHDAHVHPVKTGGGPPDDVQMPQCDGVEAAGIDGDIHSASSFPPRWYTVSLILP